MSARFTVYADVFLDVVRGKSFAVVTASGPQHAVLTMDPAAALELRLLVRVHGYWAVRVPPDDCENGTRYDGTHSLCALCGKGVEGGVSRTFRDDRSVFWNTFGCI